MLRLRSLFSLLAALSVLPVLVGGSSWAASGAERSLAIFPEQRLPLRFSHKQHLADGSTCVTCHDVARKSDRALDLLTPKHPECEACHDLEAAKTEEVDPPSACITCHPGFDQTVRPEPARLEIPTPNLHFTHRAHVERKIECVTCHGKMTDVELATRMQLPKMATCLGCHDGWQASAECRTCHLTQPSGRLQLQFLSGELRPAPGNPFGLDHGPRFEFSHAARGALAQRTCSQCHAQNDCLACHDSMRKPLSVHPNDYVTLHPVQARVDAVRCESCHRLQSFCAACHERVGVGLDAAEGLRSRNTRIHPPYQEWVEVRGPRHHGIQASRDVKECVACHREESCMVCHAEESRSGTRRQVNPHPAGFRDRCRQLSNRNERPCLKCHEAQTLAERGCR